jgi:hypothetical protein
MFITLEPALKIRFVGDTLGLNNVPLFDAALFDAALCSSRSSSSFTDDTHASSKRPKMSVVILR